MFALQADMAMQGQRCHGIAQPFGRFRAVRIVLGGGIDAHIAGIHQFPVQYDPDHASFAGDGIMIPLAGLFDQVFGGGLMTEDGGALPAGRRLRPLVCEIIGDLDLYGMGYPVIGIAGMDHYAAVGAGSILKIQVQHKIIIGFFTPDRFILSGGEDTIRHAPDPFGVNGVGKTIVEQSHPSFSGCIRMKDRTFLRLSLQAHYGKEKEAV